MSDFLKNLDNAIADVMTTEAIMSSDILLDKLPTKYVNVGFNWYIREKYIDYCEMSKKDHRYVKKST